MASRFRLSRHPAVKSALDRAAGAAAGGLIASSRWLGDGDRERLARACGDVAHAILPARRAIGLRNLRGAFPEREGWELEHVLRQSFRHFSAVFFESFVPRPAELRAIASGIAMDGFEPLAAAVAAGRGAFYVTAHFGNWELMAHALALRGCPLAVLVRRTKNARLDAMLDALRTATGNTVIDKDDAVPRVREVLGRGGVAGVLMDQNVLGSKAAFVDFFGRPAATTPIVALLALRSRIPIFAGFAHREGFARYRVRIQMPFSGEDPSIPRGKDGVGLLTSRLNAVMEREIRASPETWLWSHDRYRTREVKPVRIAVRMPNWIGDAVMAEPALRAIAGAIDGVELRLRARGAVADLFAACGYVVDPVRSSPLGEEIDGEKRVDASLVLPNSLRAAAGALRGGGAVRVGFARGGRARLFTHPVLPPARLGIHQVDRYLALVAPLLHAMGRPAPATIDGTPRLSLRSAMSRSTHAVLAPGAAFGSAKRWDEGGFVAVGRALLRDGDVLVAGGPEDAALGSRIACAIGSSGPHTARSLAGQTSISEAAALLARARIVIANDSGLMHLAAALGAPAVGLFGATDPAATGPRGPSVAVVRGEAPCSPCRYRECPVGRICWGRIDAARVLGAIPPQRPAAPAFE